MIRLCYYVKYIYTFFKHKTVVSSYKNPDALLHVCRIAPSFGYSVRMLKALDFVILKVHPSPDAYERSRDLVDQRGMESIRLARPSHH